MNEQHKQTIREALEWMADDWAQLCIHHGSSQKANEIVANCKAALAALDEPEWTPLPDGTYDAQHNGDNFILFDGFLNVEETDIATGEKRNAEIALPPDYALCRRPPRA